MMELMMGLSTGSRRLLIFTGTLAVIAVVVAASGVIAQQQAFNAEREYVAEQLRDEPCLTDWGVNEGAAKKRVSVVGVAAGGLRITVSMPYAYTVEDEDGEPVFADAASDAVYEVTLTGTRRVRGDDISIC